MSMILAWVERLLGTIEHSATGPSSVWYRNSMKCGHHRTIMEGYLHFIVGMK